MTETYLPSIDVVVSTFNEEAFIDDCLEHLLGQTYRGAITVWVVDGGSTDATVEHLRRFESRSERVRVIADGSRLNLPEALNVAIPLGRAELVAKVDAHGYPEHDFLERAVSAFAAAGPRTACVGGRPEQVGQTPFARALCVARGSRFGVGASEYAGTTTVAKVDTVQCGVYRRAALEEVGGFDARMNYGEDEELNWRLRRAGYEIVLDTSIRFRYYARPSWKAAFRQYRNYGRARVGVIEAHPEFARLHHAVPAVAVGALGTLGLAAAASDAARKALAGVVFVYGASATAAALREHRPRGTSSFRVVQAFSALHLGYGVGMLEGLGRLRPWRRRATG
jgi:glycosyltransferase involved in cell wall biosynthesis